MLKKIQTMLECVNHIENSLRAIIPTENGDNAVHVCAGTVECCVNKGAGPSDHKQPPGPRIPDRLELPKLKTALELVEAILMDRRARYKFLVRDLCTEPAWAMLLDLYRAELKDERLCVSSLCHGSGVPETTALRYLQALEAQGYVTRTQDEHDKRRSYLALDRATSENMAAYCDYLKSRR